MADVQHDIDVFFIFKIPIEAHDVLVSQRPMNLDLTCQLLSGLSPCQVSFWHYFQRPCLILVLFSLDGLELAHFVALSESSFTEEALAQVFDDFSLLSRVVRVHWFAFFLDDLQKLVNFVDFLLQGNCSCQCETQLA